MFVKEIPRDLIQVRNVASYPDAYTGGYGRGAARYSGGGSSYGGGGGYGRSSSGGYGGSSRRGGSGGKPPTTYKTTWRH